MGFFDNFVEGWQRITGTQDNPNYVYKYTPWEAIDQTVRDITLVPGFDNFNVGLTRIVTGRVGKDGNPTWNQAWTLTDDQLAAGWLPGGAPPEIPDILKDAGKGLLLVAAAVGAVLIASK